MVFQTNPKSCVSVAEQGTRFGREDVRVWFLERGTDEAGKNPTTKRWVKNITSSCDVVSWLATVKPRREGLRDDPHAAMPPLETEESFVRTGRQEPQSQKKPRRGRGETHVRRREEGAPQRPM